MALLKFKVQADYDEVIRLRKEIERLKSELKGMDGNLSPAAFNTLNSQLSASTKKMDELVTEAAKAGAVMETDFKRKIFDASQAVNGFTEKIIAQKAVVKDVEADVKRLGEAYRNAKKNKPWGADANLAEYNAARKVLDEEKAALFALTQEQANARLSVKKLRDEYALYKDDSKEAAAATEGIGFSLKKAFAVLGGAALGKQLISDMVRVRGEFQAADTAIQTLLGSKEKADSLMSKVRDYAKISPLEFSDVTSATQMMLGFNIEAEKVPRFLQAIGDVSMGDTQKFNSLTLAFSQMSAAGKLMGQDLNQMINAGFNPLQIMAEKSGKSIAQLKEEMSKGAISAEMVQQAFIDATSAGGKFYQMSENASKTINGQLSMMQDAMDAAFNEMGQKSEGFIIGSIQATTKLIENYETVGKVLAGLVITYGTYKAALIANIALTHSWAVAARADAVAKGIQTAATKAATVAQLALNAAMKANPYVLLITTVAALGTAMWALRNSTTAAEEAQKRLSESTAELNKAYYNEKNKIDELFDSLKKSKEGTEEYKNAKDAILSQYGEYLAKLGDEKNALDDVTLAYKAVTEGAWRAAKARMKASLWEKEGSERMNRERDDRTELLEAFKDFYGNRSGAEKDYMKTIKRIETGNDLPNGDWTNELGKYSKKIAAAVNRLLKSREAYKENIALYEQIYGDTPDEQEEVVITGHKRNKKYYEDKKKELEAEFNALTETEARGKKGIKIRKKIAEYSRRLEAYSTSGTSRGGSGKSDIDNRADAEKKAGEELLKLQQENRQAELDLEEETTEKKLKLIELSYDKRKDEIAKREKELAELNKKAGKKGLNANGLTADQQEEINKARQIAEKERNKQKNDVRKEQEKKAKEQEKNDAEQRIAYLKEYGSYLDKYGAIIEEFNRKRAELDEGDKYGLKTLDKEQEKAIEKLKEETSNSRSGKQLEILNWDTVFQNLDKYTTDYLVDLQKRLEAALDTATEKNAALIKQKIAELKAIQNQRSGEVGGIFGKNGLLGGSSWGRAAQAIRKQTQLEEKAALDKQALSDKQNEILGKYDSLKDMDAKDITSDNAKIQATIKPEDMKQLQATEATAATSGAEASGGQGATALAVTDAIIHGVNQNVQSFSEAADYLWDEDSAMNKSVKKFAESSQYATDAFDSLKSGDFVGVALNLGNAISTLGESFGIWSNSNRAEIEKENKRLADAMSFNTEALNRLTKKLSESSSATDKFKAYSQAENYLDANEQAQRHIIANNSRMYDGGHSLGYDFGEVSGSSNMLRRLEAFFEKNRGTYKGLAEFIENTSASEMEKFYASEQGVALFNEFSEMIAEASDAGNYQNWVEDLKEYMNAFGKDAREELENSFRAGVTGVTFDGFKDNFKSTLMDMEKDVHDFTNDFEKSLMQSVLNAQIEAKFGEELQALYNDWNDALASDNALSSQEIENLVSREENLTQRMIAERDRLAAITGYEDNYSSSEAKGSINAAKSMSEDTANELVGRVTAVQLGEGRIEAVQQQQFVALTQIKGDISSMLAHTSGIRNIADETRTIIANSYLELQEIRENTGAVVLPIQQMQRDIAVLKNKL